MKHCILTIAAVVALASSCQKENGGNTKDGIPVKLNLEITVPGKTNVVNTKVIDPVESEINELALIMYSAGGRREFIDLTGKLTLQSSANEGTGGKTYKLNEDIETVSGNYTVYAIANWSSNFCNISSVSEMTEDDLKSALATNDDGVFQLTGSDRFPMAYVNNDIELAPNSKNTISLKLQRLTSHIEFNFKNGTGVTFVPKSYKVFYLPKKANLISKEDNELSDVIAEDFFNSDATDVSSSSFDFFMLENVRPKGENSDYNGRDVWSGETVDPKTFTYAPDYSTYVVVTGEYSETKTDSDNNSYLGEVSYTIHLGNFSSTGSVDNFTVNRNEHQIYNVTVNGVSNIVTEVTTDTEKQSGAEGNLMKINSLFILDSHYETAMIQLTSSDISEIKEQGNSTKVALKTPKTEGYETYAISELNDNVDYKWIQLLKPTSATAFPTYKDAGYISDLVSDIVENVTVTDGTADVSASKYILSSGESYYVAAFIDEYVYADLNCSEYVNADNRVFILNIGDTKYSSDKQSSLISDYSFQISQRSIKTTYNMSEFSDIFGIETWDETGEVIPHNTTTGTTDDDGLANTKLLADVNGNSVSDLSCVGYLNAPADNLASSHTWGDGVVSNDVQACLSRNRDTDGDGEISGDEIKWYVPAVNQYYTIWLGEGQLYEDTRLFDTSNSDFGSSWEGDGKAKLITSTENNLIYWPDEGASTSSRSQYDNTSTRSWLAEKHDVRCLRNLPNVSETPQFPVTTSTTDNGTLLSIGAVENVRAYTKNDNYGVHTERQEANMLPQGLEVYKTPAVVKVDAYDELSYDGSNADKLNETMNSYLSEALNGLNLESTDGWRIPNQRELMLLVGTGLISTNSGKPVNDSNGYDWPYNTNVISSTWFTGYSNKPLPFWYDSRVGGIVLGNGEFNEYLSGYYCFVIYLVRDAEADSSTATTASYANGGIAAGVE